jgi:hypothetical protein
MCLPRYRLISKKILSTIEGFLSNEISLVGAVRRAELLVEDISMDRANPPRATGIKVSLDFNLRARIPQPHNLKST